MNDARTVGVIIGQNILNDTALGDRQPVVGMTDRNIGNLLFFRDDNGMVGPVIVRDAANGRTAIRASSKQSNSEKRKHRFHRFQFPQG